MARYFTLSVECGDETIARSLSEHFDGLILQLPNGPHVKCESGPWQDPERNWWAIVMPQGASAGSPYKNDNSELRKASRMAQMAELLYERLRGTSRFRYALAGPEVDEFRYFSELDDGIVNLDFSGLVISEEIWEQFGCPSVFVQFSPGYFWRPYRGEEQDL